MNQSNPSAPFGVKRMNSGELRRQQTKLKEDSEELRDLREEKDDLLEQLDELSKQYNETERSLVNAKLAWANLDMENDELVMQLKRKNDMIKVYAQKVTTLEIEIVNAKQQLGDALNTVNEHELSHDSGNNTTVLSAGGTPQAPVSLDEKKKKSKTSQLKSFFSAKLGGKSKGGSKSTSTAAASEQETTKGEETDQ